MRKNTGHLFLIGCLALGLGLTACGNEEDATLLEDNPFLSPDVPTDGKEDSGYLNAAGVEVEVTVEADIQGASTWNIFQAPPYLAQYATTYLRARQEIYLQIINEDTTAPERVEWLVDGKWLTAAQAHSLPVAKLTHFRIPKVNTVLLNSNSVSVRVGQVIKAKVPRKPYSTYSELKDTCADFNSHISLDQSTYWYLWNPDKYGCKAPTQDLTLTVTTVTAKNPTSYPEYDKLWADKALSVVVLFGKLDDGSDIKKDWNWAAADRFVTWLKQAGFVEQTVKMGRRFSLTTKGMQKTVDVWYPDLFWNVADFSHMANWQKAVTEHEVVAYLGHSVLGTGSAYDDVKYPSMYQIMFVGGCLGYEYYVQPVLDGKGGWANVDAVASIVENMYTEMNPAAAAFLAKLFYGFDNGGKATWQQIMGDINKKLGHNHFGVAGARGNCFSPTGTKCK
jgi:hypothetical protein